MPIMPSEREKKISTLVSDKFPNIGSKSLEHINYLLKNFDNKDFESKAEIEEELKLLDKYREELEALSNEEINKLYEPVRIKNEEERKKEIEKIENVKFHQPYMNMEKDDDFWKSECFTADEITALSFYKNPKSINKEYISKNTNTGASDNFFAKFEFPKKYLARLELFSRSVEMFIESTPQERLKQIGSLKTTEQIKLPAEFFINLAENKNIKLPEELTQNFESANVILNKELKENNKRLLEQNKKLLDNSGKILGFLKEGDLTIEKLKEENQKLTNQLTEKEDVRIIKTQNKILCGIVKGHYKDKSSRVSKIMGTLKREANIELNDKTIRTRIEEALEEDQSEKE